MNDSFEEYGSVILACVIGLAILGAVSYFSNTGYFSEWILKYANALGG